MNHHANTEVSRTLVHAQVANYLYFGNTGALLAGSAIAVLLVVMAWGVSTPTLSIGWLVMVESVYLYRLILARSYRKLHVVSENAKRWLNRFRIGAVASGFVWGAGVYLFFSPSNIVEQSLLSMIVAGVAAGGVMAYVIDSISLAGFVIPLVSPLAVRLLYEDTPVSVTMNFGVILFLGYILIGTRRNRADILEKIRFRISSMHREKAAHEQNEFLKAILENEPECVKVIAANGELLEMNRAGLSMLEVDTLEEAREIGLHEFILPEHRKAFANLHASVCQGNSGHLEFQVKGRKGTVRWLETHAAPLRDANGHVIALLGLTRDITERKQAESSLLKSELRYRTLVAASFEGVAITSEGRFLDANEQLTQMLGYELHEMVGQPISKFIVPEDIERVMANIRTGSESYIEHGMLRKDGSSVMVEAHGTNIQQAGVPMRLTTVRDISERKQAEQNEKMLMRTITLLSKCDALLVRTNNERELLDGICQLAVEVGGYLMAWVGFAGEDESKSVKPVARYGCEDIYLDNAMITWADDPLGQGPTGVAIRSGKVSVVQDIQANPQMAPWHEAANKCNYNSSLALPIFVNGKVIGALSIYSRERRAFGEDEMKLLGDLANDLSFGIQTLRVRAEKDEAIIALNKESEKNLAFLRNASDGIHILDNDGNVIEASDSFCAMLGYRRDEMIGMNVTQWDVGFENLQELREAFTRQFLHKTRSQFQTRHRRKDGTVFDVEVSGFPLELEGKPVLFNSSRDITESKRAEENLRIAATAFESQEGMLITDARNEILRVNRAFTKITGYSAEEVIGKNPRLLSSGRQDAAFYFAMWKSINVTGTWEGEIWNRRKNGEIYPERLSITAVRNADGVVTNYVATLFDITENKQAEDEIRHLAFYDPLTHLPNRRLLMDRLRQALASGARSGRQGAILFIDLDHFKDLNDTLGHDMGDLLLQQAAHRLKTCVREDDTVSRLGGDEFVVILEELSEQSIEAAAQTEAVCEKIHSALNQPYQLEKNEFRSTASIGVVLFGDKQKSIEELMKQADIALYQAKDAGRNTLRFFDPQMQDAINARASLEEELHRALVNHQFHLYYQVQVDSAVHPVGAETLIRWLHPQHGMVSPAQFIQLAEDTGLILPIGQWVLDEACAQIGKWQGDPITRDLVLAVNVSGKQFRQPDFAEKVQATVKRHGIKPMLLKLELTESVVLENIEDAISKISILKEFGVRLSLDDFGTGYSSLSYLKRLPLDQIKVDQSFVRDIAIDKGDVVMVRTIVDLGMNFELDVVAEGVETETQFKLLQRYGCTGFQGYLFGKPMPIDEFEKLLTRGKLVPLAG